MSEGYREFEFDLPSALLNHLVVVLGEMERAPLSAPGLRHIPEEQGIYQLFLDDELVYIGKTDAELGLLKRLTRHACKIRDRVGLDSARITFKAVRIFVFTAMDLETQLIRRFKGKEGTAWNGSGFGSNDPGRKRDHSAPGRFDSEYPINIDLPLQLDFSGTHSAAEVAQELKRILPYVFRFQRHGSTKKPHADLAETTVTIPREATTTRLVVQALTRQMPAGWQATKLAPVLIMYKEKPTDYPSSQVLARS